MVWCCMRIAGKHVRSAGNPYVNSDTPTIAPSRNQAEFNDPAHPRIRLTTDVTPEQRRTMYFRKLCYRTHAIQKVIVNSKRISHCGEANTANPANPSLRRFSNNGGFKIPLVALKIKGTLLEFFTTRISYPAESSTAGQNLSAAQFNIARTPIIGGGLILLEAQEL